MSVRAETHADSVVTTLLWTDEKLSWHLTERSGRSNLLWCRSKPVCLNRERPRGSLTSSYSDSSLTRLITFVPESPPSQQEQIVFLTGCDPHLCFCFLISVALKYQICARTKRNEIFCSCVNHGGPVNNLTVWLLISRAGNLRQRQLKFRFAVALSEGSQCVSLPTDLWTFLLHTTWATTLVFCDSC